MFVSERFRNRFEYCEDMQSDSYTIVIPQLRDLKKSTSNTMCTGLS